MNQQENKDPKYFIVDEASLNNLYQYAMKLPWENADPIIQWIQKAFIPISKDIANKAIEDQKKLNTPQAESQTGEAISN